MGPNTTKLMTISSSQIAPGAATVEFLDSKRSPEIERELTELLRHKNGFFAFESALHIFPAQSVGKVPGIADWNVAETWKFSYGDRADRLLCFAEDIFGNQFAVDGSSIVLFDAETGETSAFASSVEEWAERILGDYEFLTGFAFARDWQAKNGALDPADRLCPITPFVVGGEYSIENMRAGNRTENLRFLGSFATQIAGKPDGSKVRLTVK